MKINKNSIEKLSTLITSKLIDKKLVRLKTQRGKLSERIKSVMLDEIKRDEQLDKEVDALIEKNIGKIGDDTIDYQKMFNLIKHKLAKERGITL